jgi:VIT1/CCC1 family predicted Fe2+/Mn2+ transporter
VAHHISLAGKARNLEQIPGRLNMTNDIHLWMATLARGALALIVGSAVMVIPDMATTLLLLPFALVISILCLATTEYLTVRLSSQQASWRLRE